ncbi:Porin [Methylocella tundrae]|uniref:Porin n=1 Tax=Methylocella tundrae TaxID=227605 RepID=A0A8B6MAP0_METTU|nr:carbohydrate porin [Methylocella tundrae]VTZ21288.1 Porin [Methylocella tundrae]VTZ51134.1 Porin [Methylocella tundrae]
MKLRGAAALVVSLLLGGGALADEKANLTGDMDKGSTVPPKHETAKTNRKKIQAIGKADVMGPPPQSAEAAFAATMAASPARFDQAFGWKGWNIPFPSFGDSLLQDYGGWRSTLANNGFAIIAYNVTIFSDNMLSHPQSSAPGLQSYWGQRPSFLNSPQVFLTVDLSRYGIPDGQIGIAGVQTASTMNNFTPRQFGLGGLQYYQTLFDKKVEVLVGYLQGSQSFVGTYIGGNVASPFGPSASIPFELGLSSPGESAPAAIITYHMTDALYNEFGIQRSLSPTPNVLVDTIAKNPTNLRFTVPSWAPLLIDEIGYKNAAAPGEPQTWARFGIMHNFSQYQNFATGGTSQNNAAYFLADRQLWQADPSMPFTAYRGIYAGVSAMYAPPETAAFSQYYEGRLYAIGLFDARPQDMISVVYNHQVTSQYIADPTNAVSTLTGISARHATNSVTASYLAHLMPGLYSSVGLSYTDHPSLTYYPGEGSALLFLASVFTMF